MPATTPAWSTVSLPAQPVPSHPQGLLCLLLSQAHRQPLSDTTWQPSQPRVTHLPFLVLNSLVGFQVKVLREDARAAFRLFETSITQVLHFCMKGMGPWVGRAGGGSGLRSGFRVRLSGRVKVQKHLSLDPRPLRSSGVVPIGHTSLLGVAGLAERRSAQPLAPCSPCPFPL